MKYNVLMIGPDITVKGGISSVVKGYQHSDYTSIVNMIYISSHIDGSKLKKLFMAIKSVNVFMYNCIFNRPNIVHIHSSFGASFYRKSIFVKLSNIFKIPIINHIHGAEFDNFYGQASDRKKKYIRKIYALPTVNIALSHQWKKNIDSMELKNRIEIVENFANRVNASGDINKKNNILVLGEVSKRKGSYDIPLIAKEVIKECKDVKFILGGNGDIESLKKIIKDNGLEECIELKGWVDGVQKDKLLREAKIFFLPSYNEGMPMAILEAMAYGLPVITTNVGGIPTVIENNINGYVANPGDKFKFAKSILDLLKDNEKYMRISQKNIKDLNDKYSVESHINKIISIYASIVGE